MRFDHDAATIVRKALNCVEPQERPTFMRALLAHTAAALVIIDGKQEAAEAVYRLADVIVDRENA